MICSRCGHIYTGLWNAALRQAVPAAPLCLSCFLASPINGIDLLTRDRTLIQGKQGAFKAICPVVELDRERMGGMKPGQPKRRTQP